MKLLTVTEVATSLSISESLVYRLKDEGKLRCFRIGRGAIRFSEEDVMEYLNTCVIQVRLEPGKAPRLNLKHVRI
jgi:excisionase family DNA binding protein